MRGSPSSAKGSQLRQALWAMRDGIDRYKDALDRGDFQIKVGSEGYPPDLDTLVKGVDVGGKKMEFLRRIPIDPITGGTDWDYEPCRMILRQIPGTARTCLMFTPNHQGRDSMERSTKIANKGLSS
jgi:hypothetical protein